MDSNNNVYIQTTEGQRIIVARFNPFNTSPITPTYIKSYGSGAYPMIGGVMVFTQDYSEIYIGGSIGGEMLLLKISAAASVLRF